VDLEVDRVVDLCFDSGLFPERVLVEDEFAASLSHAVQWSQELAVHVLAL
jgi:hypothetical protein